MGEVAPQAFLDFESLLQASDRVGFVAENFWRSASTGLLVLLLALLLAWGAARLAYQGRAADISPHSTPWYDVLGVARGSSQAFLGVHLTDGRQIEGYLHSYPVDLSGDNLELALKAPFWVTLPAGERSEIRNLDYVIVRGEQISHVGVVLLEALDENAAVESAPASA